MKKYKILFWVTTVFIFLFEGVMSALTSHTQIAREGISNLGYPSYFGTMLMVFKVLGSLALIIPAVPGRVKEWAYAGFGIDFTCAFVSLVAVYGFSQISLLTLPVVCMIFLVVSYVSYHKLQAVKK